MKYRSMNIYRYYCRDCNEYYQASVSEGNECPLCEGRNVVKGVLIK